jgi:hypothetical protein
LHLSFLLTYYGFFCLFITSSFIEHFIWYFFSSFLAYEFYFFENISGFLRVYNVFKKTSNPIPLYNTLPLRVSHTYLFTVFSVPPCVVLWYGCHTLHLGICSNWISQSVATIMASWTSSYLLAHLRTWKTGSLFCLYISHIDTPERVVLTSDHLLWSAFLTHIIFPTTEELQGKFSP